MGRHSDDGTIASRPGVLVAILIGAGSLQAFTGCGRSYFSPDPSPPAANRATSGDQGGSNSSTGTGGTGTSGGGQAPCTLTQSTPVTTTLPANVTAAQVAATCPAVGADSECGAVIIITNSGETIYYTGQGPYDTHEDTLVGVINQSSGAITSIDLMSNLDIMAFDGDGITTFPITGTSSNVPGNPQDSSGYGGPNAYYTNISSNNDSGTVDFITPVAASNGTTYFSLENALQATNSCLSTTAHSSGG